MLHYRKFDETSDDTRKMNGDQKWTATVRSATFRIICDRDFYRFEGITERF